MSENVREYRADDIWASAGRIDSSLEKTASWQFHDLYSSPNIRIIKSRKLRWAGKRIKIHIGFWWQKLKRELGNPGADGRVILKWNLKKNSARTWSGFIRLKERAGSCSYGNEPAGSTQHGKLMPSWRTISLSNINSDPLTLKYGTLRCTDKAVTHYQTMPPNIPEQRRQTHFIFTFLSCSNVKRTSRPSN